MFSKCGVMMLLSVSLVAACSTHRSGMPIEATNAAAARPGDAEGKPNRRQLRIDPPPFGLATARNCGNPDSDLEFGGHGPHVECQFKLSNWTHGIIMSGHCLYTEPLSNWTCLRQDFDVVLARIPDDQGTVVGLVNEQDYNVTLKVCGPFNRALYNLVYENGKMYHRTSSPGGPTLHGPIKPEPGFTSNPGDFTDPGELVFFTNAHVVHELNVTGDGQGNDDRIVGFNIDFAPLVVEVSEP